MKGNLEKEMARLEEINKDLGRNEKRRDEARKDLEGIREEINRSRAAALAKAAFKDALETFATRSRENVQKGATAASTSPTPPSRRRWDVLQLPKSSKRAIGRVGRAPSDVCLWDCRI